MKTIFNSKYLSKNWWNLNGPCKILHTLNKTRINYIKNKISNDNKNILDIGCGGGILTEKLSIYKHKTIGLDSSKELIDTAINHNNNNNLNINYYVSDINQIDKTNKIYKEKFDVLICMEVIEHIYNINSVINTCNFFLKSHGDLFISTLNKSIYTYLYMILFGEYLTNSIPKKTHFYNNFIKPKELNKILKNNNFYIKSIKGIKYNPFLNYSFISNDVNNNYIIHAKKI